MRNIEEKIIETLDTSKNGFYRLSCRDAVEIDGNKKRVYLHGNLIYQFHDGKITLWARSWLSNTTKSRLNALLQKYMIGISQKNWSWFVTSASYFKADGKSKNRFIFYDGITFNLKTMEVETFGI